MQNFLNQFKFYRDIPESAKQPFFWESIAGMLFGLFSGMIMPFITIIARQLAASTVQIALLTAIPFLFSLSAYFWTSVTSQIGNKKTVVWASFIGRSIFFMMLFIHTPVPYIIVVGLFYLTFPMVTPAYHAILMRIYPAEYRGRLMGYVRIGIASMTILSTAIAGILIETWGFQWIFPIGALFGILSSLAFHRIPYIETPQPGRLPSFRFSEMFDIVKNDRRFSLYCLSYSCYGFGNLIMEPLIPIFLVDYMKISNTLVGFMGSSQSFFWMICFYFWGLLLDKYYPVRVIRWNYTIAVFVPVCFIIAVLLSYSTLVSVSILFIFLAFSIRGIQYAGGELAHMKILMLFSKEENLAKYSGIHITLLGIRGSVAPFLSVFLLYYFNIGLVFGLSAILMFCGRIYLTKIIQLESK